MFDIFVSYRTVDLRFGAAEVRRYLQGRFGDRVFLDHESMRGGEVYPDSLRSALEQIRVLVVLIGPRWSTPDPDTGLRPVDRRGDWVRREIKRALERDIAIVPVLVDGAELPVELPADIERAMLRQAETITHRRLSESLDRLGDRLVELVPELALPDLFDETSVLPDDPLPSELLRAEYRVVEFTAVRESLAELVAWLGAPGSLGVRLLVGPGGRGKTRLATEFVALARELGLHAGFVRDAADAEVIDRLRAVRGPVVLAVDYAEARTDQLVTIIRALRARPRGYGAARLLLLARAPGPWLRTLQRHGEPAIADCFTDLAATPVPEIGRGAARWDQFDRAAAEFGRRLGVPGPVAAPADLDADRFDQVLDVHAAALAAVLDLRDGQPTDARSNPVLRVLHHEERYWASSAAPCGLRPDPDTLREVVAAATLTGAETPAAAYAVLTTLRGLDTGRSVVNDHFRWLTQLYPGRAALNPLRPDRLGEDLIAAVLAGEPGLPGYPELAADIAPVLTDGQLFRALTVLARAAARHPMSEPMATLLAVDTPSRIGIAITVATQVDNSTLVRVLGSVRGGVDLTTAIVEALPERSLALAAFAAQHTKALLRFETRRPTVDLEFVAELRHDLALRLAAVGDHDQALVTAGAAVADYRKLMGTPAANRELAEALTTLASCYARLGLYEDGLRSAEEAVRLLDEIPADSGVHQEELANSSADALITLADLAGEAGAPATARAGAERAIDILRGLDRGDGNPDQRERLAGALESLGAIHDAVAELRPAWKATDEAARIYGELDAELPDRFGDALVRVLGNLAGAHAALGQWQEGAELGERAVARARVLVDRFGDVHLERLADTLNNTAALLRRLDLADRALDYLDEAIPLYRGLAARLPGIHLLSLAGALHNLGNCRYDRLEHERAIDAFEESVEIYRKGEGSGREDLAESLAETLVGLAHAHVALGDDESALESVDEALELYARGSHERSTTRRKLAHAWHLSSSVAFDLGSMDRARRDAEHAATLFPTVLRDHETDLDLRVDYVSVLHGFARALDADEQHDRASAEFDRAIEQCRSIGSDVDEELAGILVNAGVCASARGELGTALRHTVEAVRILREQPENRAELVEALNNLADIHCDRDEWPAARERADEAVALAEELPADSESGIELAVYAHITRARAAGPKGKREATTALRQAASRAGTNEELLALVAEWSGTLGVRARDIRPPSP
ncbi:tetratricopeptide repeat protein [Nocardia harenae]|uniref:tetratricopeptide repeat protein n=1 Tax=Nocardia harenae TaxID=358707 RepID=UPI001470EBF6|nr:tetratricopeptide repeat protein [Nocardia harenae]